MMKFDGRCVKIEGERRGVMIVVVRVGVRRVVVCVVVRVVVVGIRMICMIGITGGRRRECR